MGSFAKQKTPPSDEASWWDFSLRSRTHPTRSSQSFSKGFFFWSRVGSFAEQKIPPSDLAMNKYHKKILKIFNAAIASVKGEHVVSEFLKNNTINTPVYLIAIGKASTSMAKGAYTTLGDKIINGLVITKEHYAEVLPCECFESSHPIPDEKSLEAGEKLLSFINSMPSNATILFLISGGASSLVEVLKEGVSLNDLQKLNQSLLLSEKPIEEINQARAKISKIKAGGLINYLGERNLIQLLIEDIPSQQPHLIGSGLLFLKKESPYETHVLASINIAMQAAKIAAENFGLSVELIANLYTGDLQATVNDLYEKISQVKINTLIIAGGECTINLPESPGIGGRNQHMALLFAKKITEEKGLYFLSAGTDGTDGFSEAAGAIVDADTLGRAEKAGMHIEPYLCGANASPFLRATDSLIETGPTGTKVMDLYFILKV